LGKITIIKTLAIPKLIFVANMLQIPDGLIKKANKMLYKFLWGCRDKIKRRVLINTLTDGGLSMCDLETQFIALKASWLERIKKIRQNVCVKMSIHYLTKIANLGILSQMTFESKKQIICIAKLLHFYQEVVLGITKSNNTTQVSSKSTLFNQILWGNRQFTVNGACLYSESFIKSGFTYVKDIIAQDGTILPSAFTNLRNRMLYYKVINLVSKALYQFKTLRYQNESYSNRNILQTNVQRTMKFIYSKILKGKVLTPKSSSKWTVEFEEELNWETISMCKIKKQYEIKIAEFNYKLLHKIIATNENLFKWQKSHTPFCIHCPNVIHTDKHLLWECPSTNALWLAINNIIAKNISCESIVLGCKNLGSTNQMGITYRLYDIQNMCVRQEQ
jgi:hypothetical protein